MANRETSDAVAGETCNRRPAGTDAAMVRGCLCPEGEAAGVGIVGADWAVSA